MKIINDCRCGVGAAVLLSQPISHSQLLGIGEFHCPTITGDFRFINESFIYTGIITGVHLNARRS